MIRALTGMPPLLAFGIIILSFVGYALAGLFVLRVFAEKYQFPRNESLASSVFGAIGGFNSLLLALVVVTLWAGFRDAQTNANREATQVARLQQDLSGLPAQASSKYLAHLKTYVNALTSDEWKTLCDGRLSAQATRAFNGLQKEIVSDRQLKSDSAIRSDALGRMNQLDELRRSRLAAAGPTIIPEVWVVLVFITGLLLLSPTFFNTEHRRLQRVVAIFFAMSLGAVFFVAVRLDHVFCGSTSVSPTALVNVGKTLGGHR